MLNLCEEVDALFAIEVTVSEEGPARPGEAHHRQRHRDWHVHLDPEELNFFNTRNSCYIFRVRNCSEQKLSTSEIFLAYIPLHLLRSVQHLFRCRIFLLLLHCS